MFLWLRRMPETAKSVSFKLARGRALKSLWALPDPRVVLGLASLLPVARAPCMRPRSASGRPDPDPEVDSQGPAASAAPALGVQAAARASAEPEGEPAPSASNYSYPHVAGERVVVNYRVLNFHGGKHAGRGSGSGRRPSDDADQLPRPPPRSSASSSRPEHWAYAV